MVNKERTTYLCSGSRHRWDCLQKASLCCNGWTRVFAPMQYGQSHVERTAWYLPGAPAIYVIRLLPNSQAGEIAKLNSVVPVAIRERLELVMSHLH